MSEAKPFIPEEENRMEPGVGLALLTVFVILGVTAILAGLIFVLMIAISPIDSRQPRAATTTEVPAGETAAPAAAPAAPAPGLPQTAK
jgi:hypothetical protein